MSEESSHEIRFSRRQFVKNSSAIAVLPSLAVLEGWGEPFHGSKTGRGSAGHTFSLDKDWLFGGRIDEAAQRAVPDEVSFARITLPHCVAPLSWQDWNPEQWESVWLYRRQFEVPERMRGLRIFLHFDRVMTGASPVLNGTKLPEHLGGFLPFEYEATDLLRRKNTLDVYVDARWLNVPPGGSPKGPGSIDYLLPGGISGSVSLRAVPATFIGNVFAKPTHVLDSTRRVDVVCRIQSRNVLARGARLEAILYDGARPFAGASETFIPTAASQEVQVTLGDLGNIVLWDVQRPQLYDLVVTLYVDGKPVHDSHTRIGIRDARFEAEGFFLNGARLRLFGLNRHELYPYTGFSASRRLLRRDAQILRHDFNCNVVRCSHYPQSPAFLDACDETGLLVWEETPGWQYLGDESWKKLVLRDVEAMVLRDRNHPSIVVWGVRVNETYNDPLLYGPAREIAKSLDSTRPTSGSMAPHSLKNWQTEWHQDVFAFDDYHAAPDGSVGIEPPKPGLPYLVTETVGQFDYARNTFTRKYRRSGNAAMLMDQGLLHAQAHSKAASYERCAGAIAWCAFDYASLINASHAMKCPGVADTFRIPKLAGSFYMAQVDPKVRPVIEPNFYWDFALPTPDGPGDRAAIFSNCDHLKIFFDGALHANLRPDRTGFPGVAYPPFFANLKIESSHRPELRIDGYVGGTPVLSRSFSPDRRSDHLSVQVDDIELQADGADATRLVFRAVDKFGAPRPYVGGKVSFAIEGPGIIVGDNPFDWGENSGAGAVWIKTIPGRTGKIVLRASHPDLGTGSATINVTPAGAAI